MATVTAPLLSFGASGQIGKSQVYATWKGRPYVRQYVTPANRNSDDQVLTRSAFSWLNAVWKTAPADFRQPWTLAAKGQVMTDRNLFIKRDLPILRPLTALTGIILSPGAKGGLVGSIAVDTTLTTIIATGTVPDPLPPGWVPKRLIAAAIKAQNPQTATDYEVFTAAVDVTIADPGPPIVYDDAVATITGLESGGTYFWGAWFEYQKSSLLTDLAYGPATGASLLLVA